MSKFKVGDRIVCLQMVKGYDPDLPDDPKDPLAFKYNRATLYKPGVVMEVCPAPSPQWVSNDWARQEYEVLLDGADRTILTDDRWLFDEQEGLLLAAVKGAET